MLHNATSLGIAQCSGLAYRRERAREDNKASEEEPVRDCSKDAVSAGNLVCLDNHGVVRVVEYLWQSTLLIVEIALLILVAKHKHRAHNREGLTLTQPLEALQMV
ncbi:hypothetical protein CEP53_005476 [Fusarium sp. AF-6]|nr:hypothetical protein CEP53_005476 [Fusarium sp. AF-6]